MQRFWPCSFSCRIAVFTAVVAIGGAEQYPRFACGPGADDYPFCNTKLSIEKRVEDLIGRLTLEEKPFLMVARESPGGNISRLGIPAYNWGTNCIHGVQSGCGTSSSGEKRCPTPFPNPNFLGATFNESIWHGMGRIIGVELRSLWRQGVGENRLPEGLPPLGLDCWSPNINVVRDPRWGRNLETPSEDPFLNGRFGVSVTDGLQKSNDPRYLQAIVTIKHLTANSLEGTWPGPGGPASFPGKGLCPGGSCTRHTIDPVISHYDLASTYLPAFKASVKDGGALGVMCSYNSVNGVPSCANQWLLQDKLRDEWGFNGYVTGDSGAIEDIRNHHFYVPTMEDAVVAAVRAGADIQSTFKHGAFRSGGEYIDLIPSAVRSGKLDEADVDKALARSLTLRFRLGLFDPPADQPDAHISPDIVRSGAHVDAAMEAADQGLVLLKNGVGGQQPLPIAAGSRIAVIGPHAQSRYALLGNYLGQSCSAVTAQGKEQFGCVESLWEALGNLTPTEVMYAEGLSSVTAKADDKMIAEAVKIAEAVDHVVLALGLDTVSVEREGTDRKSVSLPDGQLELLFAMLSVKTVAMRQVAPLRTTPAVSVVLLNGGTVSSSELLAADAIVEAWYPGFFGARAIARALLGKSNRWGKLPVTVYDEAALTGDGALDMLDFDMVKAPGRTYRYHTMKPLWPFGFGLSYTKFQLHMSSKPHVIISQHESTNVAVKVSNVGDLDGDEVLMAFFVPLEGTLPTASRAARLQRQLFGFQRVSLMVGQVTTVVFEVSAEQMATYEDNGDRVSHAGAYEVRISNGNDELPVQVVLDGGDTPQPLIYDRWISATRTTSFTGGPPDIDNLIV
eukprot:TRINITY_DN49133_c0_g1_i1.p1 TRINITY_DN49133_c0_g1~~TRINITY_DN49133_c0_g1_i1.p1  ORF type:complete len:845 (-),score=144.80 TRINITY_DN49133_c0_g1_i1:438-2972(-)